MIYKTIPAHTYRQFIRVRPTKNKLPPYFQSSLDIFVHQSGDHVSQICLVLLSSPFSASTPRGGFYRKKNRDL
uniref:Uncharacterized protein n=1 Tax=Rhizophora mucronata TaxID=61149 RepID=A0A2P2M1F4_RHIMU